MPSVDCMKLLHFKHTQEMVQQFTFLPIIRLLNYTQHTQPKFQKIKLHQLI